jgi:hypothetical protein
LAVAEPSPQDTRAKGQFWGAAKFAFRPMTQNIKNAHPVPNGRFWLKKYGFVIK